MRANPNRVLAIVLGLVVVLIAVLALFSSTKSAMVVDPTTPAGTVQAYVKAVLSGKHVEASALISPTSSCTASDLDRTYTQDTTRVLLLSSTIDGTSSEVKVRMELPSGSPFGDVMTQEHSFQLSKLNGSWRISGTPWPFFDCGVMKK